MKRLPLLLMASLATVSVAFATTYVRVEKDGTKTYSDRPIPGGQPIELQGIQTYSSPAPTNSGNQNVPEEQRLLSKIDDFKYTRCAISPENDAAFTNPENVSISVSTEPELRAGDQVNLSLDGKVVGENASSFLYAPALRGTHSVQVTIKDSFGRALCTTSASFHVMRPSLNMPQRR